MGGAIIAVFFLCFFRFSFLFFISMNRREGRVGCVGSLVVVQ